MSMTRSESGSLGGYASAPIRNAEKAKNLLAYADNPKMCLRCNAPIPYEKRRNDHCGHSCAAIALRVGGKRPIVNRCAVCQAPRGRHKKYCSATCREIARAAEIEKEANDGTCSALRLKRHLLKKHGGACMDPDCAWDHTKRPVALELHHINGESEMNTFDNVLLLCPNCHSLTDTYKAKNVGSGRHKRRSRYQEGKSF